MAERLFITLYLDENIPLKLAGALRSRGFDAVAAQEVGRKGADDDQQVAFSIQSGRALVTSNVRHFLIIARQLYVDGRDHPGLILVTRPMSMGEMLQAFERLLDSVSEEKMTNQIAFLSDYVASQ